MFFFIFDEFFSFYMEIPLHGVLMKLAFKSRDFFGPDSSLRDTNLSCIKCCSCSFCGGFWKIFDIFAVPEGARWPDAICQGRGNTRHLLGTGSAGVRLLHMQKVSGEMRGTKGSQSRSGAILYLHQSICNNHHLYIFVLSWQARYRQYFEEDQETTDSDILLPLETQVLMQEVLSDGWAFCSLMWIQHFHLPA